MWSHNQGQDIAEGTFVKFQNPSINVDNDKSQFKKKQINYIPYMLLKKAKRVYILENFFINKLFKSKFIT